MPSISKRADELENKFMKGAPERNRAKIKKVLDVYRQRSGVPFLTVQNMVVALYSPSLINTKKDKYKVDEMYQNFLSKYENQVRHPEDYMRGLKGREREEERRDRVLGRGRKYKVKVVLFTQTRKLDPGRDPPENDYVDPRIMKAVWKNKKHKGYTQFWKGDLTVSHYNSKILEQQRWKLTERGTKEFRWLYPILMKDKDFAKREMEYPGYLDAVYLLDWTDVGRMNKEGEAVRGFSHRDPAEVRKRAAGEKVAIQFRYCSNTLDLNQETFRDEIGRAHV